MNFKNETSIFNQPWTKARDSYGYAEIRITVADKNAAKYTKIINEFLNIVYDIFYKQNEEKFTDVYFKPKALTVDKSTIAIGMKFHNKFGRNKLTDDILGVLNKAGQHLHFDVALGTSFE